MKPRVLGTVRLGVRKCPSSDGHPVRRLGDGRRIESAARRALARWNRDPE